MNVSNATALCVTMKGFWASIKLGAEKRLVGVLIVQAIGRKTELKS